MTRQQLLGLCIGVSFFLHMWALQQDWDTPQPTGSQEIVIPADFTMAAVDSVSNALSLGQTTDPGDDSRNMENAARRRIRQARQRYFQQIHAATGHRKFQTSGDLSHLLGNVLYSFRILPDDTFSSIRLNRSSGDPLLDRAAKNAIIGASGTVKRPKIIQGQTFNISIPIKYQLSM